MKTQFGILQEGSNIAAMEFLMRESTIGIVRVPLFFGDNYFSKTIDQYLKDGFDVQINFNYKPTTTPVPFPTDLNFVAIQAEKFFQYYTPYINQIPFVAIENEWDNRQYHSGTVTDYLNELRIIAKVAHAHGFKISDAGITDGGIKQWYNGNLDISEYLSGIKGIGINFLNFHWYGSDTAVKQYDLETLAVAYRDAAGKKHLACNEFGIRTQSPDLWQHIIAGLRDTVKYAIAYSGTNTPGRAIQLTAEMLKQLNSVILSQ